MAGRRRRGSTSSLEATSKHSIHWCQQSSVLHKAEPGITDNDWPIFELKDAIILNKHGNIANALEVLLNGPFLARGHMVIDDQEQKSHCIILTPRPPAETEFVNLLTHRQ